MLRRPHRVSGTCRVGDQTLGMDSVINNFSIAHFFALQFWIRLLLVCLVFVPLQLGIHIACCHANRLAV